jgi:hypothetical protein
VVPDGILNVTMAVIMAASVSRTVAGSDHTRPGRHNGPCA